VLPEICGFKRDIRIYTNPLKFALEANLCEARKIVGDDGRQILQVRPVPGAFQFVPTKSIDGKTMQSIFSSLRRLLGEFPFYSPLVCLLLSAVYVRNMKSFKLILRLISDNSHSSSIQQMSSDLESCGCIKLKQSDSGMSLSPVWLQV
jgi:hypothetical protein